MHGLVDRINCAVGNADREIAGRDTGHTSDLVGRTRIRATLHFRGSGVRPHPRQGFQLGLGLRHKHSPFRDGKIMLPAHPKNNPYDEVGGVSKRRRSLHSCFEIPRASGRRLRSVTHEAEAGAGCRSLGPGRVVGNLEYQTLYAWYALIGLRKCVPCTVSCGRYQQLTSFPHSRHEWIRVQAELTPEERWRLPPQGESSRWDRSDF
jgi:hypothetical protein